MDRDTIIETLRRHRSDLEGRGVLHAALFGSRARGDSGPKSDIDILIDIEPETYRRLGVYELVGIQLMIADLFDGPVDVVEAQSLKDHVRPSALRDAVYAF